MLEAFKLAAEKPGEVFAVGKTVSQGGYGFRHFRNDPENPLILYFWTDGHWVKLFDEGVIEERSDDYEKPDILLRKEYLFATTWETVTLDELKKAYSKAEAEKHEGAQ